MQLRVMQQKDIPGALRLNQLAGWNQTEADWGRLLAASPSGCFVMEDGAMVVGTATTLCYDHRFAWIGMVLVDPGFRNRGIGSKLLQRTIDYLDSIGIPTLKLDATPLGKPLYEKLGFVSEYRIDRWTLKRTPPDAGTVVTGRLPGQLLSEVLTRDREIFGADRSALLCSLDEQAPDLTLAVGNDRQLDGYAFGRHGLFADHLGPWIARDHSAAQGMLERFLQKSPRDTVIADALEANPTAGQILGSAGFTITRPLTRMYRGPNRFPGQLESLLAILGPEFG
jgi:GNAT superfamily N-acetyltransferase